MALRIAIVGPGRVGTAFAMALAQRGVDVLGVVGRDPARAQHCIDLVAAAVPPPAARAAVLSCSDLVRAHVVVFAVGDADLPCAVSAAAAAGGRRCSLWLHTSGRHDLDVFAPALPLGIRVGSLHPLWPFGNGASGAGGMRGALALLTGQPRSMRLLRRLCALIGLEPIEAGGRQDRVLYHAACALAANGLTALFGLVVDVLRCAGGLAAGDAERIAGTLAHAALQASRQHGAHQALSGPVRRGDGATVAHHLDALGQAAPQAVPTYVALMERALQLARGQGLPAADAERVAAALEAACPSRRT